MPTVTLRPLSDILVVTLLRPAVIALASFALPPLDRPLLPTSPGTPPLPTSLRSHPAPPYALLWRHAGKSWTRDRSALCLLGVSGWSSRLALNTWLAAQDTRHAPVDDTTLRRLWDRMQARGLVVQSTVTVDPARHHSVALVWLTAQGRDFLFELGLPFVALSEWDRLRLAHNGAAQPVHSAMVIAAAHQFRRRSYTTETCPPAYAALAPDLLLTDQDGRPVLVEVEVPSHGGQRHRQRLLSKWERQAQTQGFVAFCALHPRHRRQLSLLARQVARQGLATDLDTLSHAEGTSFPWLETWGAEAQDG